MPIYEYLCERCGRLTEVMQKVNDRPPAACPECGSKRLAKLVSRTAFQLRGGGWHADLYTSPRKTAAEKKESAPDAPGKPAPSEASPGKKPEKPEKAPGKTPPKKNG